MAYKTLQVRRDTAANWTSNNPTLTAGELGYETDTGKLKIGDGSTVWTALAYSLIALPLPIANGGTGQITAQTAIDALTQVSGATNEHVLTKDTATGNAIWKAATGGADAFTVKVDAAAAADYVGATSSDGVLRTATGLSYADGGNFVTLGLAINNLTEITSVDNTADYALVWDATDSTHKKVLVKNIGDRYVDRGDPTAYDFTQATLTTDSTWRDLNLSSIVPAGAKRVKIFVSILDDVVNSNMGFRTNGETGGFDIDRLRIYTANAYNEATYEVQLDANRIIEYIASNVVWTAIGVVVKGWFM